MKPRNLVSIVILSAVLAACASHDTSKVASAPVGLSNGVLTGNNGMTLYTFDRDIPGSGKSVCNDACAKNWPPLLVNAGDEPRGAYGIITRDDGSRQWAYKGKPLYFWAKNTKPGDMTGDGVNNIWHIAKP